MTQKELYERLQQISSMEELEEFRDEVYKNMVYSRLKPKEIRRKIGATMGRRVYCYETDTVYISIGHAADELGLRSQNISTAATKGGTTHGYHFKYVI